VGGGSWLTGCGGGNVEPIESRANSGQYVEEPEASRRGGVPKGGRKDRQSE